MSNHLWSLEKGVDDTEGHETASQAWKRLFGEELDRFKAVRVQDDGDSFTYHMPNGHSYTYYYGGEYIE